MTGIINLMVGVEMFVMTNQNAPLHVPSAR